MKRVLIIGLALVIFAGIGFAAPAISDAQLKEVAAMFPNSTLSQADMMKELRWFADASAPFRGMNIKSVAESMGTHTWESTYLTKAFEKLTGIKVVHDIIDEGSVVERIYTQMASKKAIYDIYVNDSDLVGTHLRHGEVVNLTEYMAGAGKAVTNPYLDLNDFLNIDFVKDYDGNILQLNDQQFPAVYIFRYDWFTNPQYKAKFKAKYGYDLGPALNWAAYDDIANFFMNDIGTINGKKIYGSTDYGKPSPDLGWRMSDAWLGVAGNGDKGIPWGYPIDGDWGLTVNGRSPAGFSMARGGALNSPAAVYAITKYIDWMKNYSNPEAMTIGCFESADRFGQGDVAQQIWMYACFLADDAYVKKGSPVVDSKTGMPLWRAAPVPHGKFWQEGMKIGYQDAGCWTLLKSVPAERMKAAWLWAQFAVSKTVDVDKSIVGRTFIRKSTVFSKWAAKAEDSYGGVLTFYRSPMQDKYTPTGRNLPDYALFAEQFWRFLPKALNGEMTPQQMMDTLAEQDDMLLGRMYLAVDSPKLNPVKDKAHYFDGPGAPWADKPEEKGRTIDYDLMVKQWKAGKNTF
jgi:glycerol transport system substrate-binding protein